MKCRRYSIMVSELFNPFLANAPILYPLEKNQKTKGFSGVFRVCKMGTLANGLKKFTNFL